MTHLNEPRLTSLSHGGGCGCKIAPDVLSQILASSASTFIPKELLVGMGTSDDAAVYQINKTQAIVATTDFFMPVVDDPFDFGAIAATNALSDLYAMGARPLFALALVGMPINTLSHKTIARILEGGQSVCERAGIPIAGGHTIDSVEPIYGLVGIGIIHPERVKQNAKGQDSDVLILGKPLGVGIYSAALKKGLLGAPDYQKMMAVTTALNTVGTDFAEEAKVHAMTDVTGFGLLGHLLEICKGSGVSATLDLAALPFFQNALVYAEKGCVTGASARNFASYASFVDPKIGSIKPAMKALLTDPQTSGGLLVACDAAIAPSVLNTFHRAGFMEAAVIGRLKEGPPFVWM